MASRLARQLCSPAVRVSLRSRANIQSKALARRMNSTQSGAKASRDTPWLIGSALVFGPALVYLLSPSAKKSSASHFTHNDAHDFPKVKKDSEPESSESEAPTEDAPKDAESSSEGGSGLTDDEGNEASAEELKASTDRATNTDTPKNAAAAEAGKAPEGEASKEEPSEGKSEGSSEKNGGQPTSSADSDKVDDKKSGTFQDKGDEGPTNLGDARAAAKSDKPPKKVEEDSP